jgi:SAM-dependent methyltransferase
MSNLLCLISILVAGGVNALLENQLSGDGTCYSSEQYYSTYVGLLGLDQGTKTDYSSESSLFVKTVLKKFPGPDLYNSFMEIGPGPCQIAAPLSKHFQNTILIEPNEHFRDRCNRILTNAQMFPMNFESFTCPIDGQDLIVLSHVLYHVDHQKRIEFIGKAINCLKPNGILVIAMVSDGGGQHGIVSQYDDGSYIHSGHIREILSNYPHGSIEVVSETSPVTYNTGDIRQDFESMYRLAHFLIVEDALSQSSYRNMNATEARQFENSVRQYVWSLYNETTKSFSLTMLDDFVFFQSN